MHSKALFLHIRRESASGPALPVVTQPFPKARSRNNTLAGALELRRVCFDAVLCNRNDRGDLPERTPNRDATLTAEWQVLLECARPFPDASRLAQAFRTLHDWPSLLILADDHGLLPLLAAQIRATDAALFPAEVREQLQTSQRIQTIFTLSLAAELFRILDHFAPSGTEVLLTKGPALAARCYDDPGSRQYGDLDFVVRDGDVRRATEKMIELGYEPRISLKSIEARKFPGEYVFSHRDSKVLAEFHTERTFRYHPRPLPLEELFARRAFVRFDGRDVPALSVEDELILNCIHAAKHFWTRLMWVADIAALISRQEIAWDRALSAVREVSAERMLRVGLLLAVDILSASVPPQIEQFIRADAAALCASTQIAKRLPLGESVSFSVFQRAAFRMKMRGGLLQGMGYLLRLSLSPTEEDWVSGSEEKRSWLLDAAARPFRLARKYGRDERAR